MIPNDLTIIYIGTVEDVDKLNRRQVKVTREHNEDCRKLLTLMGIPWIIVSLPLCLPSSRCQSEFELMLSL